MKRDLWQKASELRRTQIGQQLPWVPRPKGKLTVWGLAKVGEVGRLFTHYVRPHPHPQRPVRFAELIKRAIETSPVNQAAEPAGGIDIEVELLSGFGKPLLVSFDLCFTWHQLQEVEAKIIHEDSRDEQLQAYRVFIQDMMDRAVRALWDNGEIAPVAIRGRILITEQPDGGSEQLSDLKNLGFADEIARPEDLYEKYGAPLSDPTWRP